MAERITSRKTKQSGSRRSWDRARPCAGRAAFSSRRARLCADAALSGVRIREVYFTDRKRRKSTVRTWNPSCGRRSGRLRSRSRWRRFWRARTQARACSACVKKDAGGDEVSAAGALPGARNGAGSRKPRRGPAHRRSARDRQRSSRGGMLRRVRSQGAARQYGGGVPPARLFCESLPETLPGCPLRAFSPVPPCRTRTPFR